MVFGRTNHRRQHRHWPPHREPHRRKQLLQESPTATALATRRRRALPAPAEPRRHGRHANPHSPAQAPALLTPARSLSPRSLPRLQGASRPPQVPRPPGKGGESQPKASARGWAATAAAPRGGRGQQPTGEARGAGHRLGVRPFTSEHCLPIRPAPGAGLRSGAGRSYTPRRRGSEGGPERPPLPTAAQRPGGRDTPRAPSVGD